MISLKKIILSTEGYKVEDGLEAIIDDKENSYVFSDEFWGRTSVTDAYLAKEHMEGHILKTIESVRSENIGDCFVTLTMGLKKSKAKTNQILVFMPPYPIVNERIKTTGKILFTRYPSESVILLDEGDTLSFINNIERFNLKVFNGELKLIGFTKI